MRILCVGKKKYIYNLLPFTSLGGYKRETLRSSFSIVAWDVPCVTHRTFISSPAVTWEHVCPSIWALKDTRVAAVGWSGRESFHVPACFTPAERRSRSGEQNSSDEVINLIWKRKKKPKRNDCRDELAQRSCLASHHDGKIGCFSFADCLFDLGRSTYQRVYRKEAKWESFDLAAGISASGLLRKKRKNTRGGRKPHVRLLQSYFFVRIDFFIENNPHLQIIPAPVSDAGRSLPAGDGMMWAEFTTHRDSSIGFVSPFLGYASMDWQSACKSTYRSGRWQKLLTVLSVTYLRPPPTRFTVCMIYTIRSSHSVGFSVQ